MEKKERKNRVSGATPVKRTQSSKEKGDISLRLSLNPKTARQAVILSEIIGKPVSKRKR